MQKVNRSKTDTIHFIEVGEWLSNTESELKEILLDLDNGHVNLSIAHQQLVEIREMMIKQNENLRELRR